MSTMTATRGKTYELVYMAVFTALLAICSWISIPTAVPFTMQTFAVFTTVAVLGGKKGTLCILVYILLGAVGLPVFAGFTGGMGMILGTTGGYLIGFIFTGLVMWAMEKLFGKRPAILLASMILGLLVCYAFGTAWFMAVYTRNVGAVGIGAVLGWCVLPFLIPDIVKIGLAMVLSRRLKKYAA